MDDLQGWINNALQEAKRHSAKWRQEAREWYDFYAGNQWKAEDVAQMEEQRKVPVVFNRVARTVNAVIGLEIQNRQAVQYIPREVGDTKVNEIFTSAADWIRDNCDAEDEESESFQDLVICGIGATETWVDYEEEADGKPLIERLDPLETLWDPIARKKNLRDRRWCARVKRVTDQDIRELVPEYVPPEATAEKLLDDQDQPHDADPPHYSDDKSPMNQPKHRELVQFQWYEKETFYRFQDPVDGQIKSVNAEQAQLLQERYAELAKTVPMFMPPEMVEQKKKVYYQAYLVSGTLIQEPQPIRASRFTIQFMTGARDRNNNTWFGLVAVMLDPQRWANKWLSQIMHILNSTAKGGLIAERDAFAKTSDAESSWAKSETITWAQSGAVSGNKLMPKPSTPMPDGFAKLLDFAVSSINDVPGVNMELMGLVGSNQPGVLEDMRKQAGMTILAVFFDSIRLYRKEQGRILIDIIQQISDGRLIRVIGKDGAKYVPLTRDQSAKQYDVVVDESPTSPNNKDRVFKTMVALAPALKESGIPLTPDLLDYSPLPSALVEKWQEFIKQNKQIPPEVQAKFEEIGQQLQVTQAQAQALAQENFKLKTDTAVEVYKVNKQAEVDRQLAAVKAETESEKNAVEIYKKNVDAMLERMTLAMDTMTANMRAASEAHIPRTEQAVGRLGESLVPALQQLMDVSTQQTQHMQGLGPALQSLGQQIVEGVVQGVRQAFADNRLVSSEPVYDDGGRMRAIKRRFGDGSMDELPYGRTVQ